MADESVLPDPNFLALMQEVGEAFKPAISLEEAGLKLTTGEVFARLQALYPSDTYTPTAVFTALQELGFQYADPFRNMEWVWLFA